MQPVAGHGGIAFDVLLEADLDRMGAAVVLQTEGAADALKASSLAASPENIAGKCLNTTFEKWLPSRMAAVIASTAFCPGNTNEYWLNRPSAM